MSLPEITVALFSHINNTQSAQGQYIILPIVLGSSPHRIKYQQNNPIAQREST